MAPQAKTKQALLHDARERGVCGPVVVNRSKVMQLLGATNLRDRREIDELLGAVFCCSPNFPHKHAPTCMGYAHESLDPGSLHALGGRSFKPLVKRPDHAPRIPSNLRSNELPSLGNMLRRCRSRKWLEKSCCLFAPQGLNEGAASRREQFLVILSSSSNSNIKKAHPLPPPPSLCGSLYSNQSPDTILGLALTHKERGKPNAQLGASTSSEGPLSRASNIRVIDVAPLRELAPNMCKSLGMLKQAHSPSTLSPSLVPPTARCPQDWIIGTPIGQGTFGVVYEGLNLEDGSFFAVKISNRKDYALEIQQEVDVLSKLDHPNIVCYLGSTVRDGRLCILLELVRMGSLKTLLQKYKRLEDSTIRSYTRQILLGLVYLHKNKTIHRDIKCTNILVDVNGQVKLSDFGVAKEAGESLFSSLKGTPLYMAPEVLSPNGKRYSFSADIWSLGCTVLEMANGKPPWSDLKGFGFLFKVKSGELPPVPDHLSPEGKDFIFSCLRLVASDRPSAVELLQHPFMKDVSAPESLDSLSRQPNPDRLAPAIETSLFPTLSAWHCPNEQNQSKASA